YGYPADTPQKTAIWQNLKWLADIFPPPAAGERYPAINYPFVYRIFSRCAKGIAIFLSKKSQKKIFLSCKDMTLWGVLLIENQKKTAALPRERCL
ncbi:hypothetical protein, partial [Ruminococcus sp.]|uniref:hypothetical protein n=1 Tax=Ruminococcus sp. TaxID=41978 RepID=UPI001B26C013